MAGVHGTAILRTREVTVTDVPSCVQVLTERTSYEGADPLTINEIWPQLLRSGRMKAALVEDSRGEVIAFGASAFVTNRFVEHLRESRTPLVARQLMESVSTPFPGISTVDEIARANAGSGNTVFILHSGLSDAPGGPEEIYVPKAQLLSSFLELHRGYQVSNVMVEAFGDEERSVYEFTSFDVIENYASFAHWDELPVPAGSPRSSLMGLSRERAVNLKAHILLPFFLYNHPQCGFSGSEQELLRQALRGHTDEELAEALNLSLSGVKKQWIRIFEKAETNLADRFTPRGSSLHKGRGFQRRHRLLRELRDRPEELTPYPRRRPIRPAASIQAT